MFQNIKRENVYVGLDIQARGKKSVCGEYFFSFFKWLNTNTIKSVIVLDLCYKIPSCACTILHCLILPSHPDPFEINCTYILKAGIRIFRLSRVLRFRNEEKRSSGRCVKSGKRHRSAVISPTRVNGPCVNVLLKFWLFVILI